MPAMRSGIATGFVNMPLQRDRSYWLEQLDGASRVSFLPDFPRPDEPTFRGARIRLPLDEATWQALEAAALGEQATLSMLLFAALALLLRNHSGASDVTIGVAAANRNHVGSESCVGTLVNTLPVRARLEGCSSFNSLLRHVRQQFLDAMDHQDMPFELLVNLLQAPRQSGLSPLFGVMLNVLNTPPAIVDMPGLDVERVEIDRLGAQFDLTLTVDRRHSRSIWFEYATDLYRPVTMQRLANRYMALLTNVIQGTAQSLDSLPAIAADEALVLSAWGRGAPAAPADLTLRDLISRAAARRAEALAVHCGSESLSYSALQQLAAQVTAGLLKAGVRPGDRVGLMLGRSARLPAAILGTLDAGAAFVPLDPDFPVMRLSYMCRDAGLALIIAEAAGTPQELRDTGVQIITLDELCSAPVLPGAAPDHPWRRSRLHSLHFRHHRSAEGSDRSASRPGKSPVCNAGPAWPAAGRPVAGDHDTEFRHLHPGAVAAAHCRCVCGHCITRAGA